MSQSRAQAGAARIREHVQAERQPDAILSHQEVVAALAWLQDYGSRSREKKLHQAADIIGLDPAVLSTILTVGLSALECPLDGFHFEVLATRSTTGGR